MYSTRANNELMAHSFRWLLTDTYIHTCYFFYDLIASVPLLWYFLLLCYSVNFLKFEMSP